jgi:hypothetical protein
MGLIAGGLALMIREEPAATRPMATAPAAAG